MPQVDISSPLVLNTGRAPDVAKLRSTGLAASNKELTPSVVGSPATEGAGSRDPFISDPGKAALGGGKATGDDGGGNLADNRGGGKAALGKGSIACPVIVKRDLGGILFP